MKLTQTIAWSPFSDKHKNYINSAFSSRICVAEGAIRSGKTIDHCIIAANYLETRRDKIHLASGSTIGNAKLNIGVCNGFGLENLFRGRCKWGKYRDNEALYVQTKTGEKVVVFAGGGKADSYKRILGNSYGLWIATEINEHYDSDDSRTSFIKVAFGRQIAAQDRLVLWDLNPCNPKHPIYENYIDAYKEQGVDGYLYEHFTIDDNLSVTPERRREIEADYKPGSVWYRRDILGQRCVAEGLIYQDFADNNDKYVISDAKAWLREHSKRFSIISYGVDFGGTGSATKFQCTGITPDGFVIALDEEYIDHKKKSVDPDALNNHYELFMKKCIYKWGGGKTWADSEAQILKRGLASTAEAKGLRTTVHDSKKLLIKNRIDLVNLMIGQGRFFVSKDCPHLIEALSQAMYDSKAIKDTRLDDGTTDIDSLDAMEYSIEPYYKQLEAIGHTRYIHTVYDTTHLAPFQKPPKDTDRYPFE